MSASPDFAEWAVHCLDVLYGAACLAFLAVALCAVAGEILGRLKGREPLTGTRPPEGGGKRGLTGRGGGSPS
jgi:hypothetical protein